MGVDSRLRWNDKWGGVGICGGLASAVGGLDPGLVNPGLNFLRMGCGGFPIYNLGVFCPDRMNCVGTILLAVIKI